LVFLNILARGLLIGLLVLISACTNVIFQPSREAFYDPARLGLHVDDLFIKSDGVILHGWRLPARGITRGTVLFLHGNGQNISAHLGAVYWLPRQGYEVLMFDYRGYGRSTGTADIDGVQEDVRTMLAWAASDSCAHGHKLTVLGHSFGGSLAIYATAMYRDKSQLNGLISISAFSDYREISRDALSRYWLTRLFKWPLSFTIDNYYRPVSVIGRIAPLPVYILHGQNDPIVPTHHADELYAAANEPKYRLNLIGGHNDIFNPKPNRHKLLGILNTLDTAGCEYHTANTGLP